MTDRLAHVDWSLIPEHMRGSVRRWIEHGVLPGGFLSAVIRNDLVGAVRCADDINRERLADFVIFFGRYAPPLCWGSPEQFASWKASGGLTGLDAEDERQEQIEQEREWCRETDARSARED